MLILLLSLNHTNLAMVRNAVDCERLLAVRVCFQIPCSFGLQPKTGSGDKRLILWWRVTFVFVFLFCFLHFIISFWKFVPPLVGKAAFFSFFFSFLFIPFGKFVPHYLDKAKTKSFFLSFLNCIHFIIPFGKFMLHYLGKATFF